ncbi:MAG: rane-bound dehydrogenase domain protein [Segetibacter sp.]|nr:rane-bound dehydrogenase domain protein [Segetibacter sp.]
MRKVILLMIAGLWLLNACSKRLRINGSNTSATNTTINDNTANTGSAANVTSIKNTDQGSKGSLKSGRRGEVLFLGNVGKHHDAGKYAPWLAISLFKIGVNVTYTTELSDLNTDNLNKYDGLIIYSNHDSISPSQEAALKSFVEGGKGLIPIHSAAGCFRNSEWYIKTVGAQYQSETTDTFTATIVNKSNPVMQGLSEFETWDEKYVHQKINPDKTVLMERVDGTTREPWTWIRKQGKGRVFYTAYGHNDTTWSKPGFMKLVNNGVLWAIGDEVKDQIARLGRTNVGIYTPEIEGDFTKRHLVPKMQEALSPENSMKLTQVPVDFEVKLFASEPDIVNPIAMSWDERGRLWIVESVDYPNTFLETDGAANDRIKICEDTDGDGKADKFTVFADKLNIPTSMVFANGGVIVSMAPYFVFLKDTNGDDKADIRENLMTGWDKGDTHFGPSNLQYGFDNKIWGVVGSGFNGTTKDGKTLNFRTGVYHVKPDGTDFEFLANTSNNTWGLGFSEENNVFISTANNTHSAYYSMPAKYMQRALSNAGVDAANPPPTILPVQKIDGHYDVHTMTPNLRQVDVVGGFTSAAGHHLYTARSFPKEYWNRMAFICEPTVRLLHSAIIEPKGAGFVEKDNWNLMASSDEWFGPVQAEVGPDGAVWVADWYNFIIQHNVFVERQAPSEMVLPFKEQPRGQGNAFISPLRDINFGRIYRVIYKKAQTAAPIKLSKDSLPGLLAALENDNMFWRMTAQRLIVESKNMQALPALYNIVNNQKVDAIGLNSPAVHALWTLHGMGVLNGSNAEAIQVAIKALSHPAAAVRKAAVEVLPKNQQTVTVIETKGLLNDPNLNTRMAVIKAITSLPPSQKLGELIFAASLKPENGNDDWLSKALLAAAITHEEGFLSAAAKSPPPSPELGQSGFTDRITKTLSQEIYSLPRRGTMVYPPDVTGKEIIIKGTISKAENRDLQGVIMAQGGKDNGYGIYIQNGKLNMVVKQDGQTFKAIPTDTLPERFDFLATLSANGEMSLHVDGKEVAKSKAPALFKQPFVQGVRVAQDFNNENRMGDYEGTYNFTGNMQSATIELKKPKPAKAGIASIAAGVITSAAAKPATAKPVKTVTINIRVVPNVMKFNKTLLTVKARQKVTINLENPDVMQHNMVIIKPGTTQKVGAAADALARDPNGADKQYVPRMPEVLHFIKLLNPGEDGTLEFIAPATPGDYPFVCTFPGHWRIMNGILRVTR